MKIVILCNDEAKKGFFSEHGLSLLINDHILFDTGTTDVFLRNAKKLNINLEEVKYIIISHGHYDHAGGLKYLENIGSPIFISKKALNFKFSNDKYIGPDHKWSLNNKFVFVEDFHKVDDFVIFGNVPMYEETLNKKYRLSDKIDLFEDEINLYYDDVLFTGCAHRGIENILKYAMKFWKIEYVVGGFHLMNASKERIFKIAKIFSEYSIKVVPLHCTGKNAVRIFKEVLKEKVIEAKAGDILTF